MVRVQAQSTSNSDVEVMQSGPSLDTNFNKKTLWQRLGQSVNFAGIGLFLRVLFVSLHP